jgi:hypothetical protein
MLNFGKCLEFVQIHGFCFVKIQKFSIISNSHYDTKIDNLTYKELGNKKVYSKRFLFT